MVDVLDSGSQRPLLPRWVWLLGAGVAAAVLIVIAVTRNGSHHKVAVAPTLSSSPTPSSSPALSPSPTPSSSPAPSSALGSPIIPPPIGAVGTLATTPGSPWPSASGACGDVVDVPLRTLTSHYGKVTGTVLVGGGLLETIRLDQPTAAVVSSQSTGPGMRYAILASRPGVAYAETYPCDPSSTVSAGGFFYTVDATGTRRLNVTGDELVGGAHRAWVVRFPPEVPTNSQATSGVILTPLDGGATITLEPNAYLFADTTAGLVVGFADPSNGAAPAPFELVDATTGRLVRTLDSVHPFAAQGHDLIEGGQTCNTLQTNTVTCSLERLDLLTGRATGTYRLPGGRTPVSNAVFSPDGRMIAFQLTAAANDPRFATDFPASGLAILHLDTGRLVIVPNLEFAPKTSVGLTFDTTGSSLLALVDDGDHGELLIWQEGMPSPALVVTVPGPFAAPPALLLIQQ